jgi:uncharacterized membrane protein (DUF4010 family)
METGIDHRLIGLGIALGLGLIVGLEREWAKDKPVGLRSFALISTFGGLSALMAETIGVWTIAGGLIALAVVLAARIYGSSAHGTTTLLASLVVFLIGAAAVAGFWLHALVLGGLVTLLLHWKGPLHGLVRNLGREDLEIIARFVLISLVILPVLPNETYGPYQVFNPFKAWLLVVLIVSINLVGYVAFRWVGTHAGAWLAGILGGLVSSTATTVSYAGMSKREAGLGTIAALVILVASTVAYGRIVVELLVVAPSLVWFILGPGAVFCAVLLGLSGVIFHQARQRSKRTLPTRTNPAQIRLALTFGALYVLILFAVAAVRARFGENAIYAVAFVSGLTDVDALTLSVGQMYASRQLEADLAWRSIFLASLSNLLFKALAAGLIGSPSLRRWIWGSGAIGLAAGVAILLFWPGPVPSAGLQ